MTLAAFLSGPRTKALTLDVSDADLDAAREAAAGPLPADNRKLLNRLRELTATGRKPKPPTARDRQRRETERRLLAAARKLFSDYG